MASLKRSKTTRKDQPALFGEESGPGDGANAYTKAKTGKATMPVFVGNKTVNPSKTDVRPSPSEAVAEPTDETPPPSARHKPVGAARPTVHIKRYPASVLMLSGGADDATALQRHLYVAKNLLFVEVSIADLDVLPDTIHVRFIGEEVPPIVARECHLLTVELVDQILEKCVAAEQAYERKDGSMSDLNYRIMRQRWNALMEAWAKLPTHVRDFSGDTPAATTLSTA